MDKLRLKMSHFAMCICLFFPVLGNASTPVHWLPAASDSLDGVSSSISSTLKHQVVASLYETGVLSRTFSKYRDVRIKLYNTSFQPYALVFLYSNRFFRFKVARVNLDQNNHVTGVIPNYHLHRTDLLLTPQASSVCTNKKIKAMLFLPASIGGSIESVCSKPKSASFDIKQVCRVVDAFKKYYQPGDFVALIGRSATVSAFNHYIACPDLQLYFSLSSEDTDPSNNLPAGVAFWAYDPTEVEANTDPKITSNEFDTLASTSLQTAVVGACHIFSDNTTQGMCPTLMHSSRLTNLGQYASGATSLDIPGAEATYACFAEQYLKTHKFAESMQQCSKQNDSLIKGNDSHIDYIVNGMSAPITINGRQLAPNDTLPLAIKSNLKVTIVDQAGDVCTMQPGIPPDMDINNVDQGFFQVRDASVPQSGTGACFIENLMTALPAAERPTQQGSGVVFGAYTKQDPTSSKCRVMKTQFTYQISDDSQGKCKFNSLSFDLRGVYDTNDPFYKPYNPVTIAAEQLGDDPAMVHFTANKVIWDPDVYGSITSSLGHPGYYYVGHWHFALSHVQGLSSGCQLNLVSSTVFNDTTGSRIHMSLTSEKREY